MNHYRQMLLYKFIIVKIKHIHYNFSKLSLLIFWKCNEDLLFSSLEEEGIITECLIKVLDDTDTIDFDFQTENVVTKVVFKVSNLWWNKHVWMTFLFRLVDLKKHSVKLISKLIVKYFKYFLFHFYYFII